MTGSSRNFTRATTCWDKINSVALRKPTRKLVVTQSPFPEPKGGNGNLGTLEATKVIPTEARMTKAGLK